MKKMIVLSISLLALSIGLISCGKENAPASATKQALLAHTWQMESVTEFNSGAAHVAYQLGAANNDEDFSSIRQTYKNNGTIQYVDEFGDSGNNATYQLLDNKKKIRITYSGLSVTGESLVVNANQFAYTIKYNTTDSSRFVFSPF